jgi:hypothetical protein
MKSFQTPRDAVTNAPAPPTKNPSAALRLHAPAPRATRHIHQTTSIFSRQPVQLPTIFLINGQIIRNHPNQLKTNPSPHF